MNVYFYADYRDCATSNELNVEFARQLEQPGTVGAIVHLRCPARRRLDHYVAIVPRRDGSLRVPLH